MTFSEDVEQILREHGRCEFRESLMLGDCVTCGQPRAHERHSIPPTRQQIIQDAVREWAKRHLNDAPEQYRKGDLEKFFGCCPEMQTEAEAALLKGWRRCVKAVQR